MNVTLVHNPKSGSAKSLGELRRIFKKADITIIKAVAIGEGFENKLRQPIKNGEIIAVLGGDGTVSAAAGLLVHTDATLLPLPGGTLNHFTKDLDVPQDLSKALAIAREAKPKSIDVAEVNDLYFINNSSLGLYPQSLSTRERLEDKFGKWPSAAVGVLRTFFAYHHYHLKVDDKEFVTPFIFVGNNDYRIGDNGTTERTSLQKGVLSVAIIKGGSRWSLVKIFVAALFGRLHSTKNFEYFTVRDRLVIRTRRRRLNVSHDGELSKLSSPVTYKLHKKALKVLA